MFEFIKGTVDFVGPEYIVIENSGIGFQISTPNPFIYAGKMETMVTVYTYHYVREDVMALYGFETREEKKLFTKLLNVSGIGPKGALAILASGEVQQVVNAIENEDEKFLVKFPGVGKKTARQMILDLKGKLQDVVPDFFPNLFNADQLHIHTGATNTAFEEAVLALQALGYSEKEIKKISPELQKEQMSTDQYIKKALQRLLK
ncbi:Holliday junction branch migration protein RuvA [Neobacillus kokaensis]|uniref:Holliday junction branch migration complex subunit RuvA n=1 Tax=Neobacillus kokaensis TaxID=2759023 RepID=A0ABQ3N0X9_9BACI|nr:Holliday junction branch migration protein RuvA [Neobacillus kokaensis]GHH97158.1 Holliday junction ATP-dependent DNA helicase RuvA [Neobacillus kokaensis]